MKYICLLSLLVLFSCGGDKNQTKENIYIEKEPSSSDSEYLEIQKQFAAEYKERIAIDTLVDKESNTRLIFEHFSLPDTLMIPAMYNWSSTPQDYVAHSFVSHVKLIRNENIILDTLIRKEFFNPILEENLIQYAVLLYPVYDGFDKETKTASVHYSISIPMTDIGVPAKLFIGLDGELLFSNGKLQTGLKY